MPRRSIRERGLGTPLFLLNLKTYPSALGPRALRLGRKLERYAQRFGVAAAIAPASPDLAWLARELNLPVLAQHVDPGPAGAATGWVRAEAVASAGAMGSLLNHSEHPLPFATVRATLRDLRKWALVDVVCAATPAAVRRLAPLRPSYLAIEPPELIGGDRSVSAARPEVITETVRLVRRISPSTRVLCGAGVHDREDVRRALELGSEGVLVASAVALDPHPERAIRELLAGY